MKRTLIAFGIYVAAMSAMAAYRWYVWSYGADTGTFTQIALNAFTGFYNTSERGSHFAVHWSPILVVLYPFAALTHSGLSIQIVQIVLVGASIVPFYALLRRYVDERLAGTLAVVAALYPPLLAVAFDEFHEIAFYPVLVFALLWAIDAGRVGAAALFATLLLLVREEALLVVAIFGAVLAVAAARTPRTPARGILFLEPFDRRSALVLGASLAVAASGLFGLYFGVIAPSFGGWTASHFYSYPFARGPLAVVAACLREPWTVLQAIATPGRATYLLEAFAPLLFLGIRSPWMLLVVPGLAVVVLSSDASAWRMGNHYAGLWAPWLLVATAERIVSVARAAGRARVAQRLGTFVIAACTIVLLAFDPMHPGHYLRAPYGDRENAGLAFAATPADASVFTHDEWFAHLAGRRPALEHVWNDPQYAILASDFPHPSTFLPFLRLEVARGCYAAERRFGNVTVYHRTIAATSAPACRLAR